MTRLRKNLKPLLKEIFSDLKKDIGEEMNFNEHFVLTSNPFTITAFDLTSRTVRFFNHLTTPQLNIIDFLYMTHSFECIQISKKW